MNVIFTQTSWQQYVEWQNEDKAILGKINEFIKDIIRNGPMTGIGKPEVLKYYNAFSRRINQEHRLVYNFDENYNLIVISCKYHYQK